MTEDWRELERQRVASGVPIARVSWPLDCKHARERSPYYDGVAHAGVSRGRPATPRTQAEKDRFFGKAPPAPLASYLRREVPRVAPRRLP